MANTVPSLERAMLVMHALAAGGETTSLGLSRRLGISQSSCYRILRTLEAGDWIRTDARGEYIFAVGLMPFVQPLLGIQRAIACLRPAMEELSRTAGVTVKLSAREGVEQVTVTRVEAQRHLSVTSPVGTRSPVVLGASGACLLVALDEAAVSQQIAYADRESLWEHESADMLRGRMEACRKNGVCDNIGVHPQGIDTLSAPLVSASRPLALTMVGLRGDFDGARLSMSRRLLLAAVSKARPKLEALV